MFSHFFIDRPIFAAVVSIVIMILGGAAMVSLPVERYPNIAPPSITVTALYPGADAQTVADTVASPIEQEVNGVEGMIYMSSVCGNDGTMSLTVTFETGADLDMANVLTQNRVSVAIPKLPQEVQRMGVTVKKKSTDTNLFIAFFSPDGTYDDVFLSNYVNLQVKDELARVEGVGEVKVYGTGSFSMRIWLDPMKLKARSITADDVVNAVRSQNMQVAAGQIGEPPAEAGQPFQYTINVQGRLTEEKEFEEIVIRTGTDGRVLRLGDVARVELGADTYAMTSALNGLPAATLAVYQIPGANAIAVADGVKARLDTMRSVFPEGLTYRVVYDNTNIIKASLKEVVETLFITLILVILTVYIFLQNFRATLVPSLTIPVSLIGTFAAMSALGFSINQFTLFGLVLVIGIVVDDAIVVVENCTRHIEEGGLAPKDAAKKAMSEVFGPVIATTLVLLAVFVPTAFMPGIMGQLFRQFAVTIAVATCFSTINALTLSPALCGILLRPTNKERIGPFFRLFNRMMDATARGYKATVAFAMKTAVVGLLIFAVMVAAAMWGFSRLPTGFVPQEDEGYCMINVQLPDAASQERIQAFMKKVEGIVGQVEGVENYLTVTGFSLLDGSAASSAGFCVAVFKDWDERSPAEHQQYLIKRFNAALYFQQDAVAFAFPMPSLPGVGLTGGFTMMLQDRGGVGLEVLEKAGQEFIADGNTQAALTGMSTPFRANVPQLLVDVDRERVLTRGLAMKTVFDAMQQQLGSVYINDLTLFNRVFKVKAQADRQFRADPRDILRLEIRNPEGQMVPLGSLAEVRETLGPQSVTRYNMFPSVKIMGQPESGFSSGQAMEVLEDMAAQKLPSSMGTEWSELSYQEKQASGAANMIFVLAVVLVYLVLAAQYESWTVPMSVCLAVPTALLGAVASAMLRQMDNNVYMQVGVVLLIGLSTKSAILIVEFAKSLRDSGKSAFDAALEAAHMRFRAVLMTAFSFILGVLPLLVASGAGAESRKVLGTVVFGGMLVATVISLICVPMLYFVIERLSEMMSRKKEAAS